MNPFRTRRRYEGLGLAFLLSALFLALCIWLVYRRLEAILGASKITGSISWVSDYSAVLLKQLAVFGFGVLLVHAAFGVAAWALARVTRAAFPVSTARALPILTMAWSCALASWVLVSNAAWYPASNFSDADFGLPGTWSGVPVPVLIAGAVSAGVVVLSGMALWRRGPLAFPLRPLAAFGTVMVAGALALPAFTGSRSAAGEASPLPHIVILGVDSLRDDLSEVTEDQPLTPRINAFLAGSRLFTDTISPLPRTFPAWVSILTGRHPVTTNARFNLMPRALVHEGDTLADALRAQGYRSVFATDEVRFANFDSSYGFDELITPEIGASDFVLGAVGDQPLVNIVAGSWIGAWLFPQIHTNRANAVIYRPEHFVGRLDRELRVNGPSFLTIHLTLAHWPYSWAGQEMPTNPQEFRPAYRRALQEVDRQFQAVLDLLERKGVLQNAIVVVLSDHGEALGFPSDTILRKTGTHREIWDSLWGHGTSVVSPRQYGVVLAMRAYGSAQLPGRPGRFDWPVSLEDVRPTLEELVTARAPSGVDGVSLLPFLAEPARAAELQDRVRFTETCFNTIKMLDGKITESGVVSEAGIYYELAKNSGWVQLRPDRLPEILAKKQRAAVSRDALLAVVPSWTDDTVTYLYSDRRSPVPRRLQGRPDPLTDPTAARLWNALNTRFEGELPAPEDASQM